MLANHGDGGGRVLLVASGCSSASVKRCQREACALGKELAAVAPGVCVYARHSDVSTRETLPCRVRDLVAPLAKPWFGAMRPLSGVDIAVVVGGTPWTRASDVEVCLSHNLHVRAQPPLGDAAVCHFLHRFAEERRMLLEASGPELVVDETLATAKQNAADSAEQAVVAVSHDADLGDEDRLAAHAFAVAKAALWSGVWSPDVQMQSAKMRDGGIVFSLQQKGFAVEAPRMRFAQRGMVVSLRRGCNRFTAVARSPTKESNLRTVHRRFVKRVQAHNVLVHKRADFEMREGADVARDCATAAHALSDSVFCETMGFRLRDGCSSPPAPEKWVGTVLEMREALTLCGAWAQAVRIAGALRGFERDHATDELDNCIAAAMIRFAGQVGTIVHQSPTFLGGPHDKARPLLRGVEPKDAPPLRGARPGWGHARYLWDVLQKNDNSHVMRKEWRDALLLLQCTTWLRKGSAQERGIANVDDWATLARSRWLLSLGEFQSASAKQDDADEIFASELLTRVFPQPLVW